MPNILHMHVPKHSLLSVYTATNRTRGGVEVLPVLGLASGEVELPPFRIGLKHPIRNVMEMCINHSTNEAVLPVLISLMVHCDDDKKVGGKQFQVREFMHAN